MRALEPKELHPPFAKYSHGIVAGDFLVTSGQLGISAEGHIPEDAEAQARLIFSNLDAILAEGGMDRRNVLRLNAYVTAREHMQGYMTARDDWVAQLDPLPTSTLMVVAGFTRPEFKVEIEVLARRGPQ